MDRLICNRCKQLTWPDQWCQCDPREQMADFLREECVILMPDEMVDLEPYEPLGSRPPTPEPPQDELAERRRRRRKH